MNKKITSYLTKMKRASGQYRKRLGRCPQLPVRLWIEPTNRCNLKCIMCPNADPPKDAKYGDMDMALYRKLIDEAAGFAIDINLFARGESLLHKDIFEMIRYANSKGLRTRLETNATILDKDRSRELIDSGLNFLSFSIDGYAKEAYEKIRVNGVFEVTMKNILDLLEAKKASGRKRPFVMIQVIELASIKEGVDKNEKTNFINLFKGLPVNGFRFIVPHRFGGVIDKDVTGTDYAYMEREGALGYKYTPCPYPWYGMSIYYDGSVLPCCLNFFDNYIIGDANRQPLKEIWNGAPMVSLREKLSHERHGDISMCKQCDFLYQRSILGFSTKGLRDIATFLKEVSND